MFANLLKALVMFCGIPTVLLLVGLVGVSKAYENCPDGQGVYSQFTYYSDPNCSQLYQAETLCGTGDTNVPGSYVCGPAIPSGAPGTLYVKLDGPNSNSQVYFTRDQSCPPGKGAVGNIEKLRVNDDCIQLQGANSDIGITGFPSGGGPDARRSVTRRQGKNCNGFRKDKEQDSYTPNTRVSTTVRCQNSGSPCPISESDQMTSTVESSWSTTAGVDDFGFSVSATFGGSYSQSESTTIQEGVTVPVNQEGFLAAYAPAILFTGAFTGCDDGTEPAGTVLAVKGAPIYQVEITNE